MFHVIKLANEAVDQVRREEARNNFQIKGRRYIFLKNVDHLTQEEKEALGTVKANKYRRFSASNPAERVGDSRAKTVDLQPALVCAQAV